MKGSHLNNNTHDASLAVPIFYDEEEPVYYDCDFSAKKNHAERNFDVRSLTIKEELYGEV